jgi:hypothetical protein
MKTESMIERVARAMCVSDDMDPDSPGIEEVPAYWQHYLGMARAVIEELRSPSRAMFAAAEGFVVGCCNMSDADLAGVWSAMIDASLSEKGE